MKTKYTINSAIYAAVVLTPDDVIQKLQKVHNTALGKPMEENTVKELKAWLIKNKDSTSDTKSIQVGKISYLVGVIPMEHVYKPRKKENKE